MANPPQIKPSYVGYSTGLTHQNPLQPQTTKLHTNIIKMKREIKTMIITTLCVLACFIVSVFARSYSVSIDHWAAEAWEAIAIILGGITMTSVIVSGMRVIILALK